MSIRKRKSKKTRLGYSFQVYFSYVDKDTNKRKFHSKSGFETYEDAKYHEINMKNQLKKNVKYLRKTVDQVFCEWLEIDGMHHYQENTVIDYKSRYYKHIHKSLGNKYLDELDYKTLQKFFNEKSEIGIQTNLKLKEILNDIIKFAIKCNYIQDNPMKYVHVYSKKSTKIHFKTYNDSDFESVISKMLKNPTNNKYAYVLALYIGKYTGMRISEVFALSKQDFNFENKTINVNKKLVYSSKKRNEIYISNKMKTSSSQGILPLHIDLERIIQKWFDYCPSEYLFMDDKGNFYNPKQLEYTLWKICKELDIQFNFHMLRHTFASNLVNNGVNVKVAQDLLRHANISTTMNIYTHINEEMKQEAIYKAFPLNK